MNGGEINPATRTPPQTTHGKEPERGKDGRKPFTDQDKVELIAAVREYPFLYNTKDKWFDENLKRQMAWREISTIVGHSAKACKQCWKSLVHSLKDYRKRKLKDPSITPWTFDTQMDYLTEFLVLNDDEKQQPTEISAVVDLLDDDLDADKIIEIDDAPDNHERNLNLEENGVGVQEVEDMPTCKVEVEPTEINIVKEETSPQLKVVLSGTGGFFSTDQAPEITFDAAEFIFNNSPQEFLGNSTSAVSPTNSCDLDEPAIPTLPNSPEGSPQNIDKALDPSSIVAALRNDAYTLELNDGVITTPNIILDDLNFDDAPSETEENHHQSPSIAEEEHSDDMDMFFASMAKTVKKFSLINRAMVKAKVFAIINEIELIEVEGKQHK